MSDVLILKGFIVYISL